MDPITHTMLGATLAQSGLKERTALGTSTLLIGANLPDVDVLAYFWGGEAALAFRRGLTHGILAVVVLPLVLTGLMVAWGRLYRQRRGNGRVPVAARQLLLLSYIAVATHPILDFLNSYGMRFLAPFSWRWFYGDTLFIIDPWVWLALAAGLGLASKGQRAPRIALGLCAAYVLVMAAGNLAAREYVRRQLAAEDVTPQRIMTAPLAVTPFERWVVSADSAGYRVGILNWLSTSKLQLTSLPYDREPPPTALERINEARPARQFLSWARFPFYSVEDRDGLVSLFIGDARYGIDPLDSWAATRVELKQPRISGARSAR